MILADSSVWIDHLRVPGGRLSVALDDGDVAMHPFFLDIHLLASTALGESVRIWTKDRRLAAVAGTLDLAVDVGA